MTRRFVVFVGIAILAVLAYWLLTTTLDTPSEVQSIALGRTEASSQSSSSDRSTVVAVPFRGDADPAPPVDSTAPLPEDESSIRGRVIDPTGSPIDGAEVLLVRDRSRTKLTVAELLISNPSVLARTQTNNRGEFHARVSDPSTFDLEVFAVGFAKARRAACRRGDTVLLQVQLAAALAGQVQYADDRSSVANANVLLRDETDMRLSMSTQTNEKGVFEFANATPGNFRVEVLSDMGFSYEMMAIALKSGANTMKPIQIVRGAPIFGRVVDAKSRQPIRDAEVGFTWRFIQPIQVTADGTFTYPHGGTHYMQALVARAPDYANSERAIVVSNADPLRIEIQLISSPTLRGRTIDINGQPVSGVEVVTTLQDKRARKTVRIHSISSTDGRFEIRGLTPGELYEHRFVRDGFATQVRVDPTPLKDVGNAELGDITLLTEGRLIGRVVDDLGKPKVDVLVCLGRPDGSFWQLHGSRSDSQGRFTFDSLPTSKFQIWCQKELPASPDKIFVDVTAGQTTRNVIMVVVSKREISGRVLDRNGAPIASAWVECIPQQIDRSRDDSTPRTLTAADGSFSLTAIGTGPFTVIASMDSRFHRGHRDANYARVAGIQPSPVPLVLRILASSPISGTVLDILDNPIPNIRVFARDPTTHAIQASTMTLSDGTFVLNIASGDTVSLVVSHLQSPGENSLSSRIEPSTKSTEFAGVASGTQGLILRLPM